MRKIGPEVLLVILLDANFKLYTKYLFEALSLMLLDIISIDAKILLKIAISKMVIRINIRVVTFLMKPALLVGCDCLVNSRFRT